MHWRVACTCWCESNMFSDSMSFKKRDRFSTCSINAGDVLTRDARNASSCAGQAKVSGEEAGKEEVAAC